MNRIVRNVVVVIVPLLALVGTTTAAHGLGSSRLDNYSYVEVCKQGGPGITGNFTFSIYDPPTQQTFTRTVAVGSCATTQISALSAPVVTEGAVTGTSVASITATGGGSSVVWTDLANRSVGLSAPTVNPKTVKVTFMNVKSPVTSGENGTVIGVAVAAAILKLCKVAGPNVAVGTLYTFSVDGAAVTVAAGPAPGGYCSVVPDAFEIGQDVTVQETAVGGTTVTGIAVTPTSSLVTSNVATGQAIVHMAPGVTEATFTNAKGKTGWIEICKQLPATPGPALNFQFTVPGISFGTITVPAGSCSPAIQVGAGQTTVTELATQGFILQSCAALPAPRLVACNTTARTATVAVVAGGPADMTIVTFTNRKG